MYKSLSSKLVLIFIVFMIAVMATVGVFLLNSVFNFYTNEFLVQIEDGFSDDICQKLSDALDSEDYAVSQKELMLAYSGIFGFDNHRNFYILDSDANVLETSDDETKSLTKTQNLLTAMNGKNGYSQSYGTDFLDYALCVKSSDSENFCIIYIKDDLSEMRELSFMLFSIIVQALLIGLVIALIMAFFLAKAITRPIQVVTTGTKKISTGEYSHRLKIRSGDEIGTLAKNFNSMAQVIENTLDEVSGEREKLRNVFNRLNAGVAAFDEDGELLHINQSALSMLSLPENNVPTFNELTAALGVPEITMQLLKNSGSIHVDEKTLCDVQTRELVVSIDFGVFGYDGAAKSGFIVVFQNITEAALLEKNRREFIANVSHELRTPLTSVKGATETVVQDPEMPDSIRDRFLNIVLNESDRMTRIVQDLLVLSRLDNRRMSWKPSKFDLALAVNQMCAALRADAQAHGQTLDCSGIPTGTVLPIFADKERIEQVLTNIIGNAIKYTKEDGFIKVSLEQNDNLYKISVSDNGVGIPKDDIEHLFERFYRVDKSRSTDAGGTGLGLSIAKDIVDAHNGNIQVQSEFGKGTTVTIVLPIDTRVGTEEKE